MRRRPGGGQTALGDAVDAPGLSWTTGGDADWFGQTATYRTNGSGARSGAVADSQASFIETTVTGPAWFSFYWRVSSEADHDYLVFYTTGAVYDGCRAFNFIVLGGRVGNSKFLLVFLGIWMPSPETLSSCKGGPPGKKSSHLYRMRQPNTIRCFSFDKG